MILSRISASSGTRPSRPSRSVSRATAALALALGCLAGAPASAEALGSDAIRDLALRGTWSAENDWGFWSWSADQTLCLRIFGPEGDCADTGTWNIDGDVMCYELTWWGEGYDVRKNCYTVHLIEGGRYQTRYHGGVLDSVFTTFRVIE
jgi:hypothetical protein